MLDYAFELTGQSPVPDGGCEIEVKNREQSRVLVVLRANVICLWLIAKYRKGEVCMRASWISPKALAASGETIP